MVRNRFAFEKKILLSNLFLFMPPKMILGERVRVGYKKFIFKIVVVKYDFISILKS